MPMPLCWLSSTATPCRLTNTSGRPRQDDHGPLPVHPPGPAAHQVAAPVLVPHGHPPHHRDDHRGPRHGEDEVEGRQLVEDPVAVRRQQAGQRDGEDDAGPVGQHARGRQGSRLQQPGPHRLDTGPGLLVEQELRPEVGAHRVGRQRHRRRHGLDDDLGRRRVRRLEVAHAVRPGRRLVLHADAIDLGQDLGLQHAAARRADVDAVGRTHVHPVEGRRVHPVGAEHPVEVDHTDLARIGASHLAHQRVVGLGAGRGVLRPGQAIGLPVTGVDVGHGEQHHFCTKRVEDGDGRSQVRAQVLVPGRFTDVHPVPVQQVVRHLPAAQPQGDHLRPLRRDQEGPPATPPLAARRTRARDPGRHDLQAAGRGRSRGWRGPRSSRRRRPARRPPTPSRG